MSVSSQSFDDFDPSETCGANIQMPEELNFKPLPQNYDSFTIALPHIDLNEIYREETIKSKSRKTKNFGKKKIYTLKDAVRSEVSSVTSVNLI